VESWDTLGGTWITAPHAVSVDHDRLAVFAVSVDHRVCCRWRDGTDWSEWEVLGGQVRAIAAPFGISRPNRRVDLFAVNFDHAIHRRCWDASGWSPWEDLAGQAGGATITAPYMDVFAVGADSTLRHRAWRNGAWADYWESLEESVTSTAHAVSRTGRLDVFVLGEGYSLVHQAWDKDLGWKHRHRFRAKVVSAPRAFSCRSNRIDVFHVGEDGNVHHKAGNGKRWRKWDLLEGPAFSPVSIVQQGEDLLELFVLGEDSAVWHRTLVAD
jgi:hypothetical protein